MATACIPQVTFQGEGFAKPVVARFDTPHASSDGGAILLKSIDTHLGLTKRLAGGLVDDRQPGKIRHQIVELLRHRVFGVACGYAEAVTGDHQLSQLWRTGPTPWAAGTRSLFIAITLTTLSGRSVRGPFAD